MDGIKLVKVKSAKRRVYQGNKVVGCAWEAVKVISIYPVSNTSKAVYDSSKHNSKNEKMQSTVGDGWPKDSHVAHETQAVALHKQSNERGFEQTNKKDMNEPNFKNDAFIYWNRRGTRSIPDLQSTT